MESPRWSGDYVPWISCRTSVWYQRPGRTLGRLAHLSHIVATITGGLPVKDGIEGEPHGGAKLPGAGVAIPVFASSVAPVCSCVRALWVHTGV